MAMKGKTLCGELEARLAADLDGQLLAQVKALLCANTQDEDQWWSHVATLYALRASGGGGPRLSNQASFARHVAGAAKGWALRDML
eukprot:5331472-Prymnesium_polylepis.1